MLLNHSCMQNQVKKQNQYGQVLRLSCYVHSIQFTNNYPIFLKMIVESWHPSVNFYIFCPDEPRQVSIETTQDSLNCVHFCFTAFHVQCQSSVEGIFSQEMYRLIHLDLRY